MRVLAIYTSPGHNYFGHHGAPPGAHPVWPQAEVELVAGKGIVGDRFFDFKPDYRGQITFFSQEVYETLCAHMQVWDRPSGVFRRNVVVSGIDLNTLIGQKFTLQGLEFEGVCECSPCYWMDQAFHSGAEAALKGQGGLRAKILSSGILRVDPV